MSERKFTRKWNNSGDAERFICYRGSRGTINASLTLGPGLSVFVCQESVLLEDENYSKNFSSCELYR